jgi:hypothetical protein
MTRLVIIAAALTALFLGWASPGLAETRIALVIGNSDYRNVPHLKNPSRDAIAVSKALNRAGFVTSNLLFDANQALMRSELQSFARAATRADVALIYFAGHGMEVGGKNYLIPADARLATDADLPYEAVPLDLLVEAAGGSRQLSLIILDACRNNPFAAGMQFTRGAQRSLGRGLAKIEPTGNTLVVYAARDGTTAADGAGEHSPFTTAFLQRLLTPGLEIGLLFREVRDDVLDATGGRQLPYTYGSLGRAPFFFVDSSARQQVATVPAKPAAARKYDFPSWYQVVERYPQLGKLAGRGAADLCGRCRIGPDGYLRDCDVAGAASDPDLRAGVKLMASMMRVTNDDGSSAAGGEVRFPATLGGAMPPPPPAGYCKSPDAAFLR